MELWKEPAGVLAERIAAGAVSSVEVVSAHLDRIEEVNPTLHAITRLVDGALARAAAADQAVSRGDDCGPLHGVPFTVKENIDCAGTPTTHGVAALAGAEAQSDAPVVERLRAAGAIPIARTNLPDLGLRLHTDSSLHGPTLNPWNPGVTPGGSSGGEGAAIATGMSPLGLGNDIGGSVRNPALCCGIAALKPSFGRVPEATELPPEDLFLAAQLFLVEGPMARSVDDLRIAFEALAGPHVRDPRVVPAPLTGPELESPLHVAVADASAFADVDPAVSAGIDRAAAVLSDAGYAVQVQAPPELSRVYEVWNAILATDLSVIGELIAPGMGEGGAYFLRQWIEQGSVSTMGELASLWVDRARLARAWARFNAEHPLILGPIWTRPAFEVGDDVGSPEAVARTLAVMEFIAPANLLGLPSVALPVGVAEGIPQGVQVMAGAYREDLALDAAAAIEAAIPPITPIRPIEE